MGSIWPEAEPSDVLLLSGAELARLLDRDALIAAMTDAMRSYSTGGAVVPLRTVMALPGERLRILASMPGSNREKCWGRSWYRCIRTTPAGAWSRIVGW